MSIQALARQTLVPLGDGGLTLLATKWPAGGPQSPDPDMEQCVRESARSDRRAVRAFALCQQHSEQTERLAVGHWEPAEERSRPVERADCTGPLRPTVVRQENKRSASCRCAGSE